MTFVEQFQLLRRIHHLIRRNATGSARQLSEKLGVPRSSVYRYLNELKNLGACISYDKHRKTYQYDQDFDLKF